MNILFINPSLRLGSPTKYLPVGIASVMTYAESKGYYLKSFAGTGALSVSGFRTNNNQVYNLDEAANLISYPFSSTYALGNIIPNGLNEYIYGIIGEGQAAIINPYNIDEWVGSLDALQGTYGYWLIAHVPFDFYYEPIDVSSRIQNYTEIEKEIITPVCFIIYRIPWIIILYGGCI